MGFTKLDITCSCCIIWMHSNCQCQDWQTAFCPQLWCHMPHIPPCLWLQSPVIHTTSPSQGAMQHGYSNYWHGWHRITHCRGACPKAHWHIIYPRVQCSPHFHTCLEEKWQLHHPLRFQHAGWQTSLIQLSSMDPSWVNASMCSPLKHQHHIQKHPTHNWPSLPGSLMSRPGTIAWDTVTLGQSLKWPKMVCHKVCPLTCLHSPPNVITAQSESRCTHRFQKFRRERKLLSIWEECTWTFVVKWLSCPNPGNCTVWT